MNDNHSSCFLKRVTKSQQELPAELQDRFPELTPVSRPPTLITWNGIGSHLYGRSRVDEETGTHCVTQFLVVLFLPIFAPRSLRVAPSGEGYHVLGREPLGSLARGWNMLVLASILVGGVSIGISIHTNSPEYRAGERLAVIEQAADRGDIEQLGKDIQDFAQAFPYQKERIKPFAHIFADKVLADTSLGLASAYSQKLLRMSDMRLLTTSKKNMRQQLVQLTLSSASNNPGSALRLLDQLEPVDPLQDDPYAKQRLDMVRDALAEDENNVSLIVRLALALEEAEQMSDVKTLLEPHADQLGKTEGARILGQIWSREGEISKSYDILWPYADHKLSVYHKEWESYERRLEHVQTKSLQKLNDGRAPMVWYNRYEKASEAEQQKMVDDYIYDEMDQTPF